MNLADKYRPKLLKNVVGQPAAVKQIKALLGKVVPQQLLLSGPSGCGKTTVARILASKLDCAAIDFKEINAAQTRGIESIRKIESHMRLKSMGGKSRIYLIDEAHCLTSDAQNAMLKMIEEPPRNVYFILATTLPEKLLKTVQTRCTPIKFKSVGHTDLESLIDRVCDEESIELSDKVKDVLIESSEGSPRQAIVLLQSIEGLEDDKDKLKLLATADAQKQSKELINALVFQKPKWPQVAAILKGIEEDPEKIRRGILGMARIMMLNKPNMAPRCGLIINCFRDHFFDCGAAGLAVACWEVVCESR